MQTTHPAANNLRAIVRAAAALNGIYSDTELAKHLGISNTTIARWWEGSTPGSETLGRLAETIRLPEGDLLRLARGERVLYELVPAAAEPVDELAVMRQQIEELRAAIAPERLQAWGSSERQRSRPRQPAHPRGTERP